MHHPLVSILICTYNASTTIEQTILSCLEQTYEHIEILIHDDQSTDETIKIIQSIDDERIRIIQSGKKLWPYKGLNFLVDHAQGKYIAIQDHDDLWMPRKIEKQIDFLESEHWKQYIWCGTKTRMRYEGDNKYFDYYLWQANCYTIHPSLVFRAGEQRYPEGRIYMNDAYFQKIVLCQWKKLIYNINDPLTIHRIKSGAENYSYCWFQFTKQNIQTLFALHARWYACFALCWEGLRKVFYPILQKIGKGSWIDTIERVPFRLMGNEIVNY